MNARWRRIPSSWGFFEPVKYEEQSVSRAVVPPSAMSQAVDVANMYENAAVARCSGDIRPTIRTEAVCREFWRVYARITGVLILSRMRNSARIECMDSSSGSGIGGNLGRRADVSDECL